MPQAIAAVLVAAGWGATAAAVAGYVIFAIATIAYGGYQKRKADAAARDAYNASLRDRLQMIGGAIDPRQLVLGRVRKSGSMAYRASVGSDKSKLVIALVLAAHEIDGVEQIYFNDVPLTLDVDGSVLTEPWARTDTPTFFEMVVVSGGVGSVLLPRTPIPGTIAGAINDGTGEGGNNAAVTVTSIVGNTVNVACVQDGATSLYYQSVVVTKYAKVTWQLGAPGQAADPRLLALLPGVWTSAHKLTGCAYLVCELDYNIDAFSQGLPNISARVRGAKVYDPRTALTAWSENVALCARHYAISPLGGNLATTLINDTAIIVAANVCDTSAPYVIDGVADTRALYTCATVATSGQRPADVLNEIVEAMAGKWCFVGNKLTVRAGSYVAPVLALGDADFGDAASIQIQPRRSRDELVNTVTGTFADVMQDFRLVDFPPVVASAYVTEDGGELPLEVTFGAIVHVGQAQHVAAVMLRDARQALVITAAFKLRAYPLEVFDTVSLTCARYGWSSKAFEVIARRWTLEGLIELTLKETASSIYTFAGTFDAADAAPNTLLPLPWYVPPITGLAVTSGTAFLTDMSIVSRAYLSWNQATEQAVRDSGHIEVAWLEMYNDTVVEWQSVDLAGDATETTLTLKGGRFYWFKVRARNTAGVRSAWSLQIAHQVANPPIISNDWTDVAGRPLLYRAVALGQDASGAPAAAGFYDEAGTAIAPAPARSFIVNVISRATGLPVDSNRYDVYASTAAATAMATYLNTLGNDRIVVIRSHDEPQTNRLFPALYTAMKRHGASAGVYGSPEFKARSAYCLVGIGGCGEGNGFESYAGAMDYDVNAWVDVAFMVKGGNLIVTGSGATPRTLLDYAYTGTLDATTDLRLIARGTCVVAGNYGSKPSGLSAWDSDIYSRDASFGACFASAIVGEAGSFLMFGLNSDASSDVGYTGIDYCFYLANGALWAYESNAASNLGSSYVAGDALAVAYDGSSVRYLKNGTLLRSITAPAGLTMSFDSSWYTVGATLRNMRFGPLSPNNWAAIGGVAVQTGQIVSGAATQVLRTADASTYSVSNADVAVAGTLAPVAFTLDGTEAAVVIIADVTFVLSNATLSSSKYFDAVVGVALDGVSYDNKTVFLEVITDATNPRTESRSYTVGRPFFGLAAGAHTGGLMFDLTTQAGATATDVVREIRTRVEVIKR